MSGRAKKDKGRKGTMEFSISRKGFSQVQTPWGFPLNAIHTPYDLGTMDYFGYIQVIPLMKMQVHVCNPHPVYRGNGKLIGRNDEDR